LSNYISLPNNKSKIKDAEQRQKSKKSVVIVQDEDRLDTGKKDKGKKPHWMIDHELDQNSDDNFSHSHEVQGTICSVLQKHVEDKLKQKSEEKALQKKMDLSQKEYMRN
jgi:hypothetical protein